MAQQPKVVELASATLASVPEVLRAIADRVEGGAYGRPLNAVVVLETEDEGMRLELFAAGSYNNVHRSLSLLALGQAQLVAGHINHPASGTSDEESGP